MVKVVLTVLIVLYIVSSAIAQQAPKPNIICIVADDLGYSDLGSYGGEINTPALDRLAYEGLRLSNMHNASMCVVSRTSLLSGKWWPAAGLGITKGTTLAEELKKLGYHTGIVGKWHLQGEPNKRGFDYFFGFLGGFSNYFSGSNDYRINQKPFTGFSKNFYSTDAFTDSAIEFIKPDKKPGEEKPFFLYLSYQAPHNPLQAPKEDIMRYRGKYLKGWQAIREARIKKQRVLGIIKKGTPLAQYPKNLPDWESLSPEQRDLEDLRMSVYAAMVERMDRGIGRLMKALEANGQKDNTFILFLSDNGNDSFSVLDQAMLKRGLLPGDPESNWQPGTGWAYAGATPWRLYKISQHGGGVKTGAIAWWPSVIKNKGKVQESPLHVIDVMPTFLDMAMPGKPQNKKSQITNSLPGQSFLSLLQGTSWSRKAPMFFQYMDNRAIRTDKWSMAEADGSGWELFDLRNDILETTDVSNQYPKVAAALENSWLNWWKNESGKNVYSPESTKTSDHYKPQGDRGSGKIYQPSAMPAELSGRYK